MWTTAAEIRETLELLRSEVQRPFEVTFEFTIYAERGGTSHLGAEYRLPIIYHNAI